jgi:uncharacterized protein YecT (DUF1311 family)
MLWCFSPLRADTQFQLNETACNTQKKSDELLNITYQKILVKYRQDKLFIEQLVKAQKKWIEFRDAYVASRYLPQRSDLYGSVFPMCQCYFIENIINERIKQLKVWLDGIPEGDVCIGSVSS